MTGPEKPRFPRIVRREPGASRTSFSWSALRPAEIWEAFREYFGLSRREQPPVDSPAALARFLDERASFIAQTSLYGYLRTRAGMRYPELFDDDPFVASINIAKWHVWLDCLSDISVYAGSRLAQHAPRQVGDVGRLVTALVEGIIEKAGTPAEAGDEFADHARRVRQRVARTDWLAVGPGEDAFTQSPDGLVRWAPVMDELKQLDEAIVRNSVRFRWQEVRRDLDGHLDVPAVLGGAEAPPSA